jgi:hypothetical protein
MATDVFLSVGRTATAQQEEFVDEFIKFLASQGLTPRAVGRNEFSAERPLKFIGRVMRECRGTVVLAFERIHIESGTEMRGSPSPLDLAGFRLPTVWNQIEAAMAHVLQHPLLVVVEKGLRTEGLLEASQEWYVLRIDLDRAALTTPEFVGVFNDWKKRMEAAGTGRAVDIENITLRSLVSNLNVRQSWAGLSAAAAILSGIIYLAYWLGTKIPPGP